MGAPGMLESGGFTGDAWQATNSPTSPKIPHNIAFCILTPYSGLASEILCVGKAER